MYIIVELLQCLTKEQICLLKYVSKCSCHTLGLECCPRLIHVGSCSISVTYIIVIIFWDKKLGYMILKY